MAENLASALDIAKDVGKFVAQLAGGGREGQTGRVEMLTQRGNRDVGRGRVGLQKGGDDGMRCGRPMTGDVREWIGGSHVVPFAVTPFTYLAWRCWYISRRCIRVELSGIQKSASVFVEFRLPTINPFG